MTVRRSFHTLKGSGRMVGARDLGEFAWSIENLLNRVLDNTIARAPALLEVLREAVSALPELIEHLETGNKPRVDAVAIASRAHALAAGRSPTTPQATPVEPAEEKAAEPLPGGASVAADLKSASERSRLEPAAEPPVAVLPQREQGGQDATPASSPAWAGVPPDGAVAESPAAIDTTAAVEESAAAATTEPLAAAKQSGPDDVLRDIYARETSAHIATVRAYLEREADRPEPHPLPEELYRACHTLSGSSKMAQARHGIRLAEPLDHWLRRVFSSGLGLQHQDLTLLADCMVAMDSVAAHLDEPTGYFVNHWLLYDRIVQADKALDQRIADAAHAEAHSSPRSRKRRSGKRTS